MLSQLFLTAVALQQAQAFPFVANLPGVDSSLLARSDLFYRQQPGKTPACPSNSEHSPAAPHDPRFPYCGAKDGKPGNKTCVNNYVPAAGDAAHPYLPPGKNDIRGPCPGLNAPANHNFLSRSGVTTFNELVNMQQNVFGLGYDLAVLLAAYGVSLDGDVITEKLSIGCDATSQTTSSGLGPDPGLNGHLRMEGDASLTRNDYYLSPDGDNYSLNHTLFAMMTKTTKGNFGRDQMALYRKERYDQSRADNPTFSFSQKSFLRYGAASFLYATFPSGGEAGNPDLATQMSWYLNEKIPENWKSRVNPYTISLMGQEVKYLYDKHPVEFGSNSGEDNFTGVGLNDGTRFKDNKFIGSSQDVACMLYSNLVNGGVANSTNLKWAAGKLNPIYKSTPELSSCQLYYDE